MTSASVVLSTFNGARHLRVQLESLADQTELPGELIVADDGSTDETVSLVEEFRRTAPFPVSIVENESRLGYGASFLNAARSAVGDYLAFCDQDDVWRPDKIEVALESLERFHGSLFVHTARLIDEHGRVTGSFRQGITRDAVRPPLTHAPWSVYYGFSMVFDRSLLSVVDVAKRGRHTFEHDGLLSHDLWIYFLGTTLGTTILDRRPLADYRRHGTNVTPAVSLRTFGAWTSSLGVAASRELRRDAIAAHRTVVLDDLARSTDDPVLRQRARAASEYWGRITAHESLRLSLYTDGSIVRRLGGFMLLVASGAYRSSPRSGLGSRLALKDLLAGVLNIRRSTSEAQGDRIRIPGL